LAQYFEINPAHPAPRLIARAAEIVRAGGVIAYPTDSCYALGAHLGDKDAMLRLRRIRGVDERHHFTLMCRDLSQLGTYARVDNARYRLLKSLTPGGYTFILGDARAAAAPAPPRRKTIGLRVPDHPVPQALAAIGEPLRRPRSR
jgi:tRNA threonylcarbamoyl adenosine modification protein (Sua5/YciO/YrdC/YwlC family)